MIENSAVDFKKDMYMTKDTYKTLMETISESDCTAWT